MEFGAGDTDTAYVWTAAAAARAWTASAHHLAAWESWQIAWMAMAEASEAGRNTAVAGAEAVGRGGRIDGAAFGRGASDLEAAVRAHLRAEAAFGRSAAQARSSTAEWEIAAGAHAMAGDAENAAMVRRHVDNSRAVADAAGKWAARACRAAGDNKKAMRKWREFEAAWPGGGVWGGDWAAWIDAQARIRAEAEQSRKKWLGRAEKAKESVRTAAEHVQRYADITEEASAAIDRSDAPLPAARDAMDAWKAAVEAARQAVSAWRTRE